MTAATRAHVPVMVDEVRDAMKPRDGGLYVDATFGAGGYARALLDAADCRVVGIDRDGDAVAAAAGLTGACEGRLRVIQGRFAEMTALLASVNITGVDGVMLDIGVSSMQIDDPARGFSFQRDGPLDMRMDRGAADTPTAADIVNTMEEGALAQVLRRFGEERHARKVARLIVERRAREPITRTATLAAIAADAYGARRHGQKIHPATRTFQALRIFVNNELDELGGALLCSERLLKTGGRLCVVAFHSLEERIVKTFLHERAGRRSGVSRHAPPAPGDARAPSFRLISRGALTPGAEEIAANPRARSAKLRIAERLEAPAWGGPVSAIPAPPRAARGRSAR